MSQKVVHLVWNAGKDAYAGNRLVQEIGPMMAVHELTRTLVKTNPGIREFDAINMASNILQYQTLLAQGCMPCHATRQRMNKVQKREQGEHEVSRDKKTNNQGEMGKSA